MTHSAALSPPAARSADRFAAPAGVVCAGPAQARLNALAGQLNRGSTVQRLAALGAQATRTPTPLPGGAGGAVVQRLMTANAFAASRAGVVSNKLDAIGHLLTTYAATWGYWTPFGEYDGKQYRQARLRLLNDLEHQIHAYFRDSGAERIAGASASAAVLALLDDTQAEHEKQIATLATHTDELPVDDRKLSIKAKGAVLDNWQSIVGGTGNLRITGTQHDKATGLTRTHDGFRTQALSSVARLLQEPHGRELIGAANEGGKKSAQHITIAPVGKTAHQVQGGTINPGGWDAEALDQGKNALLPGAKLKKGQLHNLNHSGDPLSAFEHAARRQHESDGRKGVRLGNERFAFNQGIGSRIGYIAGHRDSENRVVTRTGNGGWREGLSPTSVALGHELGHAVRNRRGANVNSAFTPKLLDHVRVDPDNHGQWSNTDEELVNIRQVENKLLVEKDLAPRDFHKDYDGAIVERLEVRAEKYHNSNGRDQNIFDAWQNAMAAQDYVLADTTLTAVGY